MVVISLPTTLAALMLQDFVATPSMWTVHAPHCAMPQPYLVPVSPMLSRRTHSNGVSGSMSTVCAVPFTFRVKLIVPPGDLNISRHRGDAIGCVTPGDQARTRGRYLGMP